MCVVRTHSALESVEQQHSRSIALRGQSMNLQKITVGRVPTLQDCRRRRLSPEKPSPQSLQMTARNPPGRRIDYVTRHCLRAGEFWSCRRAHSWEDTEATFLAVQIFGIRKSADTRKALRFFSERRIKTHFVDLTEKPASLGELRRFAQKFGVMSLVDKDSKRFEALGLRYAQLSDDRWLQKLSEEPLLLRIPLVRNASQLTVGADESTWKSWVGR